MTNIFSQPLMMLHGPLASSVFSISLLQFFEDAWSKSLVNDVIRILANDLWSINRHTLPLFVHGCMNATEKAAGGGCWCSWRCRMRIGSTKPGRTIWCILLRTDDPTEQPRWGRVGKQKIVDEGPLAPFPNMKESEI
jgi:hypothetical protein